MNVARALLCILLTLHLAKLSTCISQCVAETYFSCEVGIVNMTTDGGSRLRKAFEVQKDVHVEKMIVSISPSGPFLQRFTGFVDAITYAVFREAVFNVPDGNTISKIFILKAQTLHAFVAGSNTYLERLLINQCPLDRLPSTLPKLSRLKELTISWCKMIVLRLDMLVNSPNLKSLDLGNNQIRQINPITEHPGKMLSIEKLMLFGNRLQRLEMTTFLSLPNLLTLDVRQNLIVSVDVPVPIALPMLLEFSLSLNKIASLNLKNLTLVNFESLLLGSNALKQMPALPKSLPNLKIATFERNNLTQLNLSYFRTYRKLKKIDISSNRITFVGTTSPVNLPVTDVLLGNNLIATLNLTECELPNISRLDLSNNQLTVVPSLFDRYPNVYLLMDRNPLPCSSLVPFKAKLINYQLQKDQRLAISACNTTSSLQVGERTKVCCEK